MASIRDLANTLFLRARKATVAAGTSFVSAVLLLVLSGGLSQGTVSAALTAAAAVFAATWRASNTEPAV